MTHTPFISDETMIQTGQATIDMIHCMKTLAQAGVNTIIGGNCNAGKSELLGWYVGSCSPNQRLMVIDPHKQLQLDTRYPQHDMSHPFTQTTHNTNDLVKTMLKTNPDGIVVDELRATSDTYEFIRLLQIGIHGAATTHGETAHDVLYRLQTQCLQFLRDERNETITDEQCGQFIAEHIDVVIVQTMTRHGVRTISQIVEVIGFENGLFVTNHLFKQTGIDPANKPIHQQIGTMSAQLVETIIRAGVPQ